YPKQKTLVDLFEDQVIKTPDAIAVIFEHEQLTYKQLNERANQLAHYLKNNGVKTETIVPLCIERSIDMIVGILGILKAGGAYVPIDPEYPEERIGYMLEDTGAGIVVTSKQSHLKFEAAENIKIIELDTEWFVISAEPVKNLQAAIQPNHLAYVIYTSGSTGKPKGAMNEHSGVVNRLRWAQDYFHLTGSDIILQKTTFSFDVSVWELIWPLVVGSKLVFALPGAHRDSNYLISIIEKEKITVMHFVPSMLEVFLEALQLNECISLKKVLCSGEALKPVHAKLFKAKLPNTELHNLYGPTEAAIDVTYYTIPDSDIEIKVVPIGKPVSNTNIYILNAQNGLVPINITGQIFIGGIQVGRGYLNRPELTTDKFIKDIFSDKEDAKLYKTGDLGRWMPDGNIEYLGRSDDQVKIRGYRIELGEIESVLQESGMVKAAVVIANKDSFGNQQLVAYVISDTGFNRVALITFLKKMLPEYMIPALWVSLDNMPLTTNGKIDKKALPPPNAEALLSDEFVPAQTKVEKTLAPIWQQLLNREKISIHDNFFDLGGHSLLAMRVISAIRKKLKVELAIKDLFLLPTIAALSEHLQNNMQALMLPNITMQTRPERIPLSFSQERLWFIDQLEGSLHYHIPLVLKLKGDLNTDALRLALQSIIKRHEVLRTVIKKEHGIAYQLIINENNWQLNTIDDSLYNNNQHSLQQYINELIDQPFNLSSDYMLRAHLIKLNNLENVLVITMHHIASDGWSISIFVKELIAFYEYYGEKKPLELLPLKLQYADYALWQRKYLQGELLDKKINYWKEKLQNVAPLQLPIDYPRPAIQNTNGAFISFKIDKEKTR
ncbi:MAG: amino acid adenylation domain-containing protein, partial [Ginsengibacter sp.]